MCSGRTWFCLLCCRVTPKHSLIEAGAVQTSSSSGALEKVMEMGGRDWHSARVPFLRVFSEMWAGELFVFSFVVWYAPPRAGRTVGLTASRAARELVQDALWHRAWETRWVVLMSNAQQTNT
jgi:hypothetical protein